MKKPSLTPACKKPRNSTTTCGMPCGMRLMHSDLWIFQSLADLSCEPQMFEGSALRRAVLGFWTISPLGPSTLTRDERPRSTICKVMLGVMLPSKPCGTWEDEAPTALFGYSVEKPEMARFSFHCTERAVMVSLWPGNFWIQLIQFARGWSCDTTTTRKT